MLARRLRRPCRDANYSRRRGIIKTDDDCVIGEVIAPITLTSRGAVDHARELRAGRLPDR